MKQEGTRKTTSKLFLKIKNNEHEIVIIHEIADRFETQHPKEECRKKNWFAFLKPETIFQVIMQIIKAML